MATMEIVDQPVEERFYSVYSPIKYTVRVHGSISTGQTATNDDYVSLFVSFTPKNDVTDQWLDGTSGNLPNEAFAIRVPFTPFLHSHHVGAVHNNNYRYFSIDVSSLLKNYLGYNLRPCSHDVLNTKIKRDITLNQIATNLHTYYQIGLTPEFINNNGELERHTDLREFRNLRALNAALSYEEEINGYISEHIQNQADSYPALIQHAAIDDLYTHKPNDDENYYGKKKYLSVKPRYRYIGVDECEYLTFAMRRAQSADGIYAVIKFYDFNDNVINNGLVGGFYGVNINATANGDGSIMSGNGLFTYGDGGNSNPFYAVAQIGVGTRNIKELSITNPSKFRNSQPLSDFSNVKYYTVSTNLNVSPHNQIGETIKYYIDHDRTNYTDNVRFHWQSRLGGIDSYTFDGGMTRGIETSSSTYEQTIYPQFRSQLSDSVSQQTVQIGDHDFATTATENGGAFIPRRSGFTDDQYPAIRKHQVDAFGNGTAVSKPLDRLEVGMVEDLMSSPNVWIERGWIGRELFKEDFSEYTSVSEVSNNWTFIGGQLAASSDSFVTDEGHITGNKALKVGDNSANDNINIKTKQTFKYNPNKIYEFEIRLKGVAGDDNPFYLGFTGLANDKVTLINTQGNNSTSQQHYVGASGVQLDDDNFYKVFRGYVSGYIRQGGDVGGDRPDPTNHARAYTGVEYFQPQVIINYSDSGSNDGVGTTIIDYIKVMEYEAGEDTHAKVWSSLNKHYYVPVVVKDGSKDLYNSEELTTMTVDYVESRKKRVIRN